MNDTRASFIASMSGSNLLGVGRFDPVATLKELQHDRAEPDGNDGGGPFSE